VRAREVCSWKVFLTHGQDKYLLAVAVSFVGHLTTQVRQLLVALPESTATPLATCLPTVSPIVVSLLEALLDWDPDRRLTVEQALKHPFVAPHHDPADEVGLPCLQLPHVILGGQPDAATPSAPVASIEQPVCPPFDHNFENVLDVDDGTELRSTELKQLGRLRPPTTDDVCLYSLLRLRPRADMLQREADFDMARHAQLAAARQQLEQALAGRSASNGLQALAQREYVMARTKYGISASQAQPDPTSFACRLRQRQVGRQQRVALLAPLPSQRDGIRTHNVDRLVCPVRWPACRARPSVRALTPPSVTSL